MRFGFRETALICLLAAALMISPLSSAEVSASSTDAFSLTDHSGYCGQTVMWSFDADTGKLTIAGDGEMSDYAPWREYKASIKSVEIQSGVTSVGAYDFAGYTSLKSVTIADTVTQIGESAFQFCIALEKVTIPENVTYIGADAFNGCSSLTSVVFKGNAPTLGGAIFGHVAASAVYPDASGWSASVRSSCGGSIVWNASSAVNPGKATISSAKSASKKKITVTWKKVSGSTGYQIAYKIKGTSSWKTKTVSSSKRKVTVTGLKSGKTYSVKVRAYKSVNGTKYYGSWSSVKKVKVK